MKRSQLAILFVTIFIDLLGFGLIIPLLPIYIQHYGGSAWVGGALMASFSVMQFIFAPIFGALSDKFGRRPLILISLLGSAVSYYFFGAAPTLLILFIARISAGVVSSASIPTAQAYISDVTTPENRAGGMAIIGMAFGLGFAFGPIFSSVLSQHPILNITPLAMPAYAAALLSVLNFVFAFFMLPESHTERSTEVSGKKANPFAVFSTIGDALKSPLTGPPLTVFLLATFAFTAVETSFAWLVILRFDHVLHETAANAYNYIHPGLSYANLPLPEQKALFEKAATAATGTIYGIVGFTILIVQGAMMGGLAKKIGERTLVRAGALVLTGAMFWLATCKGLIWLQLGSAVLAIGNGLLNSSLTSLVTQYADPARKGAISGTQQGLASLARVIAPVPNNFLVGLPLLIFGVSAGLPFLISTLLMVVCFVFALRLKPPPERTAMQSETSGKSE